MIAASSTTAFEKYKDESMKSLYYFLMYCLVLGKNKGTCEHSSCVPCVCRVCAVCVLCVPCVCRVCAVCVPCAFGVLCGPEDPLCLFLGDLSAVQNLP